MNNYVKALVISALLVSVYNQAQAGEKDKGQGKPQRPDFATIDSNGDSTIDFDEFSALELPHGDHQTVFDDIDSDGDGIISESELANHKPPRGRRGEERRSD
ncbi:EF-hand domain-containing protein [Thalassotalea sp. PLHSN55]|uniref:EF-hand domain-containing protein n=1 Tax=Thalassotalea sp. PLHSN55 TaxID=3435888 RepID=UPI003F841528